MSGPLLQKEEKFSNLYLKYIEKKNHRPNLLYLEFLQSTTGQLSNEKKQISLDTTNSNGSFQETLLSDFAIDSKTKTFGPRPKAFFTWPNKSSSFLTRSFEVW